VVAIDDEQVWAVIPARGGSKSIPLKNLVRLSGRPLIEYVVRAARASRSVTRIICSTDHADIAKVCDQLAVEVHWRSAELSGDNVPVVSVLNRLVSDIGFREGKVAGSLCLLQPTSPFVMPEDIDRAIEMLIQDTSAESVQTITSFPHNFHAYNQRIVVEGAIQFRFREERKVHYNKQAKPTFYMFGNLIVTRTGTLLEKGDLFGERSLPRVITPAYSTDIDGPEDLDRAEWLLSTGKVVLPHIRS